MSDKINKQDSKQTKPKRPTKVAQTEKRANTGELDRTNPRTLSLSRKSSIKVANRDPNYHYRIVNDRPGAFEHAKQIGYEFVTDEERFGDKSSKYQDSKVGSITMTVVDSSTGMKGALMKIPLDLYKANQRIKAQEVEKINEAIYGRKNYRGASVDPRVINPNKDYLTPVFTGSERVDVSLPPKK